MPENIPDKKTFREDQLIPPVADSTLQETPADNEEHDLDDLVHIGPDASPIAGEEIDADDVVHNISAHPSIHNNDEKDPDDLVHGN